MKIKQIKSVTSKQKPRFFYGYIVVIASLFIMIAIWGTRYTFGVFFNPMLDEFGWTRAMISGAFSLSMALEGSLCTVVGVLTDKVGPRMVMTVCALLLMLGAWLMSEITALWQLYLVYGVLIGGAMSCAFVPLASNLTRWFVARRSMMTGIMATGSGIGPLIGSPIAIALITGYDWRFAILIMGVGSLVIMLTAAQFLRRNPAAVGQLPYGEQKESIPSNGQGFSFKQVLRMRRFWLNFTCFFGFGIISFSIMVHIVPHALALNASPASAAGILSVIGMVTIGGRLIGGWMGDKLGGGLILLVGYITMTAVMFFLVPAEEIWMLYLAGVLFGFVQSSMGTMQSPFTAELFGLKAHGAIFGLLGTGYGFGAATGPLITGYIFDVTGEYRLAFVFCGIVGIIATVLFLLVRPLKAKVPAKA